MKKLIIILFVILSSTTAKSQISTGGASKQTNDYLTLNSFKGDTLKYVQYNFIDQKQKYIGKDLDNLLIDLEIPIKSYIPGSSANEDSYPVLILNFYSFEQVTDKTFKKKKPVNIIIKWANPLPQDSVLLLIRISNYAWVNNISKYYGKKIIGNILTTYWDK